MQLLPPDLARFEPYIRAQARRMVSDPDDVADVEQEMCCELVLKLADQPEATDSYLMKAMYWRARNFVNRVLRDAPLGPDGYAETDRIRSYEEA